MKKYLYYPNLEPPNSNWLKFATLYLENVESIVPYNRQNLISEDYRKLANETDLVSLYPPEHFQGERATIKAIEEVEKILSRAYRYSPLFNGTNILREWQTPQNWNYQIFNEKIPFEWINFCAENQIGLRNNDGLLLPEKLAFIYMTHLAKEIAFERNGNIITDNVKYNNYTSFAQIKTINTNTRDKFLRGVIKLQIPVDIENVSFDTLIAFRNKNKDLITALNNQIDKIETNISNGITEREFIDSFNDIYLNITKEAIALGLVTTAVPFSLYTLIKNPLALTSEYTDFLLNSLSIAIGGYVSVKKSLYDSAEERLCKKYFARVSQLR